MTNAIDAIDRASPKVGAFLGLLLYPAMKLCELAVFLPPAGDAGFVWILIMPFIEWIGIGAVIGFILACLWEEQPQPFRPSQFQFFEQREWVSPNDGSLFTAKYVREDNQSILLQRRDDNELVHISKADLAPVDTEYIQQLHIRSAARSKHFH